VTAPALVLAPVACGAVLLVSGWAKRDDTRGTREALVALGVPAVLRGALVARSLVYVELGLGALLLMTWGWALAFIAGVVTALFAVYTVLVARVLRNGDTVDCGCFGQLGDDRITRATLARNGLLVLLAALAIAFGAAGSGVIPGLRDLAGADWWWPALTVLVAATAVLVVSPGRSARAADLDDALGSDPGDYERQPIPYGVLADASGATVSLRTLAATRPQLLVFLSPGCGSCALVAERLPGWAQRLGLVVPSTVFTQPLDCVPEDLRPDGIVRWFDPDSAVTTLFAAGRPSAPRRTADGLLAGGPVIGSHDIESFVAEILAELESASAPSDAAHEP
jgi:hypothetical protein